VTGESPAAPRSNPERAPPPTIDDEIHSKLVEHPKDVQGLLAYGIFKQSERDWIKRFNEREGRAPAEHEIGAHFYFSYDDGDIDRLRTEAENLMLNFAFSILDDERPEIEEAARKAARDVQLDDLREAIRKSGSFGRAILAGVISSVVFAILTIVLVATWFAPGLRDIAKAMTH
jgi:hypothetical protein